MSEASSIDLPELVLPDPIPVRPPKYTREMYEEEEKKWKGGVKSWRAEQRRRWVDGHAGLTGIHYFELTQLRIKDGRGSMMRPIWRDVDERNLEEYEECKRNGTDLYVFKRREFGLSTIYAGVIPIHTYVTQQGVTCLMTSADLGRLSDLINNKFLAQLNSLEDWVGLKLKKYDSKLGIAELRHFDEDGKEIKGVISTLLCRQTSQDRKDVGKFEGARAVYGFLDELFLHPYPAQVRLQTESCFLEGFSRIGIMVSGGSAGLNNPLGVREAKKIIKSSESGAVKTLFVRGSEGISNVAIKDNKGKKIAEENFCINGWSDAKRAEAYIRWQLDLYKSVGDITSYNSFRKRYPLEMSDVLESDDIGSIPKEVADMIPEQLKYIETNIPNIRRMSIEWDGGKPKLVENMRGPFHMLETPQAGARYGMGSDPIPFAETSNETTEEDEANGSMFAAAIKNFDTNQYIGIYLKRSKMPSAVYDDIKGLQILYNNCKNMIERNRGEAFYFCYSDNNDLNMLAFQPKWIGAKDYKRNTVRGWYKSNNLEKAYDATFEFFKRHMRGVLFESILNQLKSFGPDMNCDIIDAIVSCEVYHKGIEKTAGEIAAAAMTSKYIERPVKYIEGGIVKIRYEKRLIGSDPNNEIGHGGHKIR